MKLFILLLLLLEATLIASKDFLISAESENLITTKDQLDECFESASRGEEKCILKTTKDNDSVWQCIQWEGSRDKYERKELDTNDVANVRLDIEDLKVDKPMCEREVNTFRWILFRKRDERKDILLCYGGCEITGSPTLPTAMPTTQPTHLPTPTESTSTSGPTFFIVPTLGPGEAEKAGGGGMGMPLAVLFSLFFLGSAFWCCGKYQKGGFSKGTMNTNEFLSYLRRTVLVHRQQDQSELVAILQDNKQYFQLLEFCKTRHAEENVKFAKAVLKYETDIVTDVGEIKSPHEIQNAAVLLIHEYIIPNAPSEVNLDHARKRELINLRVYKLDSFKRAKAEIFNVISSNFLKDFKASLLSPNTPDIRVSKYIASQHQQAKQDKYQPARNMMTSVRFKMLEVPRDTFAQIKLGRNKLNKWSGEIAKKFSHRSAKLANEMRPSPYVQKPVKSAGKAKTKTKTRAKKNTTPEAFRPLTHLVDDYI